MANFLFLCVILFYNFIGKYCLGEKEKGEAEKSAEVQVGGKNKKKYFDAWSGSVNISTDPDPTGEKYNGCDIYLNFRFKKENAIKYYQSLNIP